MNWTTPSSETLQQEFSLFLLGGVGSGKTCLAYQFPGVYFMEADEKISNAAALYPSKTDVHYAHIEHDETGATVPPYARWSRLLQLTADAYRRPDCQTIVWDSMTRISGYICDHIMAQKSGEKPLMIGGVQCMSMSMWRPFITLLEGAVMDLKATKKMIIVIGHEDADKDEITGAVEDLPLIPGQSKTRIRTLFGNIWKCRVAPNASGGVDYLVRTIHSHRGTYINNLGLPADWRFSWSELEAKLKGAKL